MGLFPFFVVVVGVIKKLIEAFRISLYDSDKRLIWCLGGALFGVLASLMTVSLFGQPITVFYILLALSGNMPRLISQRNRYDVGCAARRVSLAQKRFDNAFLGVSQS